MSLNNVLPIWLLGKYGEAYDAMEAGKIGLDQFIAIIEAIPEVPEHIVESWRFRAEAQRNASRYLSENEV